MKDDFIFQAKGNTLVQGVFWGVEDFLRFNLFLVTSPNVGGGYSVYAYYIMYVPISPFVRIPYKYGCTHIQ
jgi:hypothetical protein